MDMTDNSTSPKPSSLDLLPQPFAWITIPAGEVTLVAGGYLDKPSTFTVPAFEIAKYPITNAQYQLFIDAGGYAEKRWWTEAGWQSKLDGWLYEDDWRKTGKAWTKPRLWDDTQWNGTDYPVIGVSWYESVAFCHWLSETTGESIMLPTDQQWQHAAQGGAGRRYPWGNEWDKTRCNNSSLQLGKTTPVTQFKGLGDSLHGVVDMCGNAWEWTRTSYKTGKDDLNGTDTRVLRGGSYLLGSNLYCTIRSGYNPNNDGLNGFRLVRPI